jgi:ubiquinone biosynthesis protein
VVSAIEVGMRRFIVQVAIDSFALFVVIIVLSRIAVAQPFPFGGEREQPILSFQRSTYELLELIVTGASLTVSYSVLRPVVIVLTGRLLLWSLGTFQVVVIAIVLAVVGWISPLNLQLASPAWLWILLAAVIVGAVRSALGALLGLTGPPTRGDLGARVWRYLDGLPTPRRSAIIENLRLQQIYDTVYGYGTEIALEGTPLAPIRRWGQRYLLGEKDPVAGMSTPAKVRTLLQQLGPTYVKLGQIIASRGDALPPDWAEELTKLQSEVRPVPWPQARQVVIDDLGKPPEDLYATIDTTPLAAASTAQIHVATLHDGTKVVVKIQRPYIVAMTKADLGVMQEIARVGSRRFAIARRLDLEGIVREFGSSVIDELDYTNEAYNARRMAVGLAKFSEIHIPTIWAELSARRVLTEEFVHGIRISDAAALTAAGLNVEDVGRVFVRALIKQVLIDGFFHGDPHPGNVVVNPDSKQIVFLDLGLVGQLSSQQRVNLVDLIFSVTNRDYEGVATTMLALSKKTSSFDEPAYRQAMERVLRRMLEYHEDASLGDSVNAVMSVVYDSGLRLDNQLTIALKALMQAEEIATALSPNIDLAQAALAESREAMLAQLTADNIEATIRKQAIRVGRELLQRLPTLESATWKWIDQFGSGQLTVKVDTSDLGRQFGTLNRIGGMLTVGMILAGALIGMAIVTVMMLQPSVADALGPLPGLAAVIFIGLLLFALAQVRRFVRLTESGDDRS